MRRDVVILGGGIVGLATAYQLSQRDSDVTVTVVEKESGPAQHQTGRNSGVIHSGIYYRPGSLKARTCREGRRLLLEFCGQHSIPHEVCGKVIVATSPSELPRLDAIFDRGQRNGVACERIGPDRLAEIEPHAAGLAAVYVPETGIVDYVAVCDRLVALLRDRGVQICFAARVQRFSRDGEGYRIATTGGEFLARRIVNCTGLHSDRVARAAGLRPAARIAPIRGEYYVLRSSARHLCRNLIYPVPDPSFPFLGVHVTRMIDGTVECGPNAVPALAREGYYWWSVSPRDVMELLLSTGAWRLAIRHWRMGLAELARSLSKRLFARAVQRLIPALRSGDLEPAPAGVRAQALLPDGRLLDDFLIESSDAILHVANAPSPAATAALEIGRQIAEQCSRHAPP